VHQTRTWAGRGSLAALVAGLVVFAIVLALLLLLR
jgi:hypothetical protein